MSFQLDQPDFNALTETIQQSHFIDKHVDFYKWLQQHVCKFIPHDVLVATWGNFSENNVHYDVSSNIQNIHTQQIANGCEEIAPLMQDLFRKWESNGDRWFLLDDFNKYSLMFGHPSLDKIMLEMKKMKSVLVYGYRDKRAGYDILYAFFKANDALETQTEVISMIMSHLDSALRGIQCLPKPNKDIVNRTSMGIISERECEVLNLVLLGKTNSEIGETLFISPNTVKNHLKSIFRKMEVTSRAEAVARYLVDFDIEVENFVSNGQ